MTKPLIMIVEDNKATQDTLKNAFTGLGCDVVAVISAEDAWVELEGGKVPQVLVLDFHLPGEDGPQFFRRLTTDPRFSKVRVVPFTALVGAEATDTKSLVSSFVNSRDTRAEDTHPIISKKGREDIYRMPPELLLSVGHAFRAAGTDMPEQFRDALKRALQEVIRENA